MHELMFVEELIREIEAYANTQRPNRVTKIKVNIGKMEDLTPSSFSFWFRELSKGSIAEGAEIEVTHQEGKEGIYLEKIEMETDE